MLEAAVRAAAGDVALVGVTVLTSHDADSYGRAIGRCEVDLLAEVGRLAVIEHEAGLSGVVCSPQEIATARGALGPRPLIVVPGIRRLSDRAGDQVRVSTAGDAARNGATHLVVGRPILHAADPLAVFRELAAEAA
jgi:orotidine-5'-phosphate decarboxylase